MVRFTPIGAELSKQEPVQSQKKCKEKRTLILTNRADLPISALISEDQCSPLFRVFPSFRRRFLNSRAYGEWYV